MLKALGREPTFTELGIFSVMWSEHCSYKSSRVHLKRLPTHSRRVVQGPGENAGIIDIGDGWACAFKIESHNHPSFIEPFQGAATGVGGILRDIFTMGARPFAIMDSLRFGPITPQPGLDQATLHKNHSVLEGVVSGVASYGNCFGVPNVGGEVKFESCYSGNPLVNAFAWDWCAATRSSTPRPRAKGIPSSTSAPRPAATAFMAPPWPARSSAKSPKPSAPTCRLATRFWRSCCSKPAWRPCRPARSSAFRTWARRG